MKYYNINSLKDFDSGTFLKTFWSTDDKLLLSYLYSLSTKDDNTGRFTELLRDFYKDYKGDKLEWVKHTIDIVYAFSDMYANLFLFGELASKSKGKKLTQRMVLESHRPMIEKRAESLESVLKEIAKPYGWSWLGLRTKWYRMNKLRPTNIVR